MLSKQEQEVRSAHKIDDTDLVTTAELVDKAQPSKQPKSKIQSLNFQILLVAMINVVLFALYTGFSSLVLMKSADLLNQIEMRRYPLQAHLLIASHSLEFINSELESAVITGDSDLLDATRSGANKFKDNLLKASQVSPTDKDEIDSIDAQFDQYYFTAYQLASEMIGPIDNFSALADRGLYSSELYESLVTRLKVFQKIQNSELSSSISAATDLAARSVVFLLITGLITCVVFLLVAYRLSKSVVGRINEMVSSLRLIAQEGGDMSVRMSLTGNDEMTELAHWFNTFISRLAYVTHKSTEDIKRIAYTDALSGLPNRRRLIDYLKSEIEVCEQSSGQIIVFMMDLDNFKAINDEYGHDAGDDVIKDAAGHLKTIISGCFDDSDSDLVDIPRSRRVVGRLGGDEFMAVLPGPIHKNELVAIANAICSKISEPFYISGVQCSIGVSVGISEYPYDAKDLIGLVGFADMAMYEAKLGGKNNHCFFNQSIADKFNHSNRVLNALKNGIESDEFSIVYQPKFNLSDDSYSGAEALLRWTNAELGSVPPDVFIELAEQSDLILEIDDWVLNAVCAQIAQWQYLCLDTKRIAINVSARQITKSGYADQVNAIAKHHNVDTSLLEIEITETSALGDIDILKENIRQLRAYSINVAMDDFGAGHSSLQLLINCQIDTLKIDKALIDQIEDDHKSLSVVDSLVNLARYLGIQSVAEGVEYEKQRYLLQNVVKCDIAQGYLFAKPMPPHELVSVITGGNKNEERVA